MKNHRITGGGGTQLHLVETGNPTGRPVLFIHGFSQCWFAWNRQLSSDLANDHRLVALDIRGHGLSDKPRDGYGDSRLWADDLNAAIQILRLDHPILCGWSYGPLLILDYIRHYGEDAVGGIVLVGGVTKLGSDGALSVLDPNFLSLVPGFFATAFDEAVSSLKSLLRLCFVQELSAEDFYLMLGYNVSVPPYVRQALFSRSFDNDDLLPRIRKPALIAHGVNDGEMPDTDASGTTPPPSINDSGHSLRASEFRSRNAERKPFASSQRRASPRRIINSAKFVLLIFVV